MSPAAAAAATGGKTLRSASSIAADSARGYHILKIDDYSLTKDTPNGEFLKSRPFTVGGYCWCLKYYPNGDSSDAKDYISVFTTLDQNVDKAVTAQSKIRFVDSVVEKPMLLGEANSFKSNMSWGRTKFIKREDFEKSKHLKGDSFALRCDIIVHNGFCARDMAEVPTPDFVSVPPSNLHHHLGDILGSEKGADVVFEVGNQTFAAHRCVLAARSPVFSAELFGMMKESDTAGVVCVEDMEAEVFKALLYFVYTDSLPKTLKEEEDVMSQHLLVAADRYNLERLKLMCAEKLCRYIDADTVATILALAEQHHCSGLKKACISFLRSPENLKAVVSSEGFKHLSRSCPTVMEELVAMNVI